MLRIFSEINYGIFIPALCISLFGLMTLYTFQGENTLFFKQSINIFIAVSVFMLASVPDYQALRSGYAVFWIFLVSAGLLVANSVFGFVALGAQRSFDLGVIALQPSEFSKVALILVLAKYFSKRHELIGAFRHILVSGGYAGVLFVLVLLQPDFGSAMIHIIIWLGVVLVAGIRLRHLAVVFGIGAVLFVLVWNFVFLDYQKNRIYTFLDPLANIQTTGWNAYQATIASGSGQLMGKGIGYGTQSKLHYLPESETDFIFASFSEEWGFVGVLIIFSLFGTLIFSLLRASQHAYTNFERFTAVGAAMFITAQFTTHVGMNIGVLPITGVPLPLMSYGGSHLVAEFLVLGMVVGMTKRHRINYEVKEIDIA